jgi:putative ABC transport system permease protein
MYVAWRDLWVARGRFALVGVVIGLVSLMTTLLSGLADGLVDDGISGLRRLPVTDLVFQQGAKSTFSRSTLTPRDLATWQGREGVAASALGVSFVNAKREHGPTLDVALFGVPADSFLLSRPEARAALSGPPGIVLSDEFATTGIKVGDVLTIVGVDRPLPVLGFTYAGSYGHVAIGFTRLDTWQDLLFSGNANGRFSAIALRGARSAVDAVPAPEGTQVVTKDEAYAGSPGYTGETSTMTMIRAFLLLISALIVGSFFTVWTMQRSRQIALLKALGASGTYVVRDAIGQMGVVLVVAAGAGGLAGAGLGALIERTEVPFRLDATSVLEALALLILLGVAGCVAGVRRVTSVDPAGALRSAD